MFLVVGLGNKGVKYYGTRHNIGFMVVDDLQELYFKNVKYFSLKKSLYVKTNIDEHEVIFLKPQTYMNNSGEAVLEAMAFFKIKKENIIVIVDDYDLLFGCVRIKAGGGGGTHNGLKSIINNIGKDYKRIRCGIFKDHETTIDNFVLSPFDDNEKKVLLNYTKGIGEIVVSLIKKGVDKTMNKYNNVMF